MDNKNTNPELSIESIKSAIHPLANFDIRSPEELSRQIKLVENLAKIAKNHWLFFYITLFIGLYKAYKVSQTNAAIMRIDKEIKERKK
jgi:hypothetical protein